MENEPKFSTAPPIPTVRTRETTIILRVHVKSIRERIRLLMPAQAIVPNNNSIIPPNTAEGIDFNIALTLPITENNIAAIAAIRITLGSEILVNEMAPVTSE